MKEIPVVVGAIVVVAIVWVSKFSYLFVQYKKEKKIFSSKSFTTLRGVFIGHPSKVYSLIYHFLFVVVRI